jgi:hypothetical protein
VNESAKEGKEECKSFIPLPYLQATQIPYNLSEELH